MNISQIEVTFIIENLPTKITYSRCLSQLCLSLCKKLKSFKEKKKSFVNENQVFRIKKPFWIWFGSGIIPEWFILVFRWPLSFRRRKIKSFILPGMRFANPGKKEKEKCSHTKIEQKFMATLSKNNQKWQRRKRIYKVLLREAKSSNLNLTPHTTVFHQFPYYSHLWTMSRVPGNRTGIEIRSFKDQLIVNLMSFSI